MTHPSDPNWVPRRHKVDDCAYCQRAEKYHPYHDPSPACKSGRREHCTCDTCF